MIRTYTKLRIDSIVYNCLVVRTLPRSVERFTFRLLSNREENSKQSRLDKTGYVRIMLLTHTHIHLTFVALLHWGGSNAITILGNVFPFLSYSHWQHWTIVWKFYPIVITKIVFGLNGFWQLFVFFYIFIYFFLGCVHCVWRLCSSVM